MTTMLPEQEIRATAISAIASSPLSASMTPYELLNIAEMMEAYITEGSEAAHKVIGSWAAPASSSTTQAAPDGDCPYELRAQELADRAYRAETLEQLQEVANLAEKNRLGKDTITIGGVEGELNRFLASRRSLLSPPTEDKSSVPLNERNAHQRKNASMRSELGL